MKLSRLISCAAIFVAVSAVYADTYAVHIGINDYPTAKDGDGKEVDNDLNGCVNDANAMKDLLTKKFSVPEANVKVLLDGQANGTGFVEAMKWLINTPKAGDQVVFSYSGHGARLDDANAEGGKQSVIVLADNQAVPGTLFKSISRDLANSGIHSTFVFDSCFSGGMSRVGGEFKVKTKSLGEIKMKDVKGVTRRADIFEGMEAKSKATQDRGQYIFLFAGKDDQPTIDITLKDRPAHGLFSMLFLASMEDNAAVPVKDLFGSLNSILDSINKGLREKKPDAQQFDQKPGFDSSSEERAGKPVVIS